LAEDHGGHITGADRLGWRSEKRMNGIREGTDVLSSWKLLKGQKKRGHGVAI
jgi:hypothetical protein